MSSTDSPLEVAIRAAVEASLDLDAWEVGKWSNSDRNEQWITSYLAIRLNEFARRTIGNKNAVLVTLESKVSWLVKHCGPAFVDDLGELSLGQRFDIAVWDEDSIVGLVEVKNAPRAHDESFGEDIKKLRRALHLGNFEKGGSLRWGVFLFSATSRRNGGATPCSAVQAELERRLFLCREIDDGPMTMTSQPVKDVSNCCLGWGAVQLSPD